MKCTILEQACPMVAGEDVICPSYSPDETIRRDKCIVIKPETAVLAFCCIMNDRTLCIIDGVVIKIAIAQLSWITGAVPDEYSRMGLRDEAVIVADTIVNAVVMPGRGASILEQPKTAAFILIGQAERYFGMGDAPVQVESTPIFGAFGSPVPKGDAMTDRHAVRLERPDAHRPVADTGHIPAIARGNTALDKDITAISRYNAIAAVIGQVRRVAGIILRPAILYENMIAIVCVIRSFHRNPGITVVPGHCGENLYVGRSVNIYARLLKAIDKQMAGRNMPTGVEDQTAAFIAILSACTPKLQAGQRNISCLVQGDSGAVASVDHSLALTIRGNDDGMTGSSCYTRRQLQGTWEYHSSTQKDGIARPQG